MSIFGKKQAESTPLLTDEEIEAAQPNPVNYDSVVDFLVALDRHNFDKIIKVAHVYRSADKEAKKILGIKDEPNATAIAKETRDEARIETPPPTSLEDTEVSLMTDDDLDQRIKTSKPKGKKGLEI